MNRSRHDHIVPYYCSFVEKTKLWLVMRMLAGTCPIFEWMDMFNMCYMTHVG